MFIADMYRSNGKRTQTYRFSFKEASKVKEAFEQELVDDPYVKRMWEVLDRVAYVKVWHSPDGEHRANLVDRFEMVY